MYCSGCMAWFEGSPLEMTIDGAFCEDCYFLYQENMLNTLH